MVSKYCSPAELRTQVGKSGTSGTGSDEALGVIIEAISQSIDQLLNHPDGFVADTLATARIYPGEGKTWQSIDECVEISAVAVKDSASDSSYTSWTTSDWIAFSGAPEWPNFNALPYTAIMCDPNGDYSTFTDGLYTSRRGFRPATGFSRRVPTVQITGKWGYALSVPPLIKQVCIGLASRAFKQGESSWADTLASVDFGKLIYQKENSDLARMLKESRMYKPAVG